MNDKFEDWFEHNYQSNKTMFNAISKMAAPPAKLVEIAGHIVQAHWIWLGRIQKQNKKMDPWKPLTLEEMKELNEQLREKTSELLSSSSFPDLMDQPIGYINSKGTAYQNSIGEVLYHVLSHSAYHRGQLALLIRMEENEPPATDYIFSKRSPL